MFVKKAIQKFYLTSVLALTTMTLMGCLSDSDSNDESSDYGSFSVDFSHFVGTEELKISENQLEDFPYEDAKGQEFNISLFGYYITQVKLIGDSAEFEDKVVASAEAASVKGFYQILESDKSSKIISFDKVPQGKYTHLEFTLGIPEEVVSEGAQGGILDLSNGAWFWGWNSGYISMKIEGHSPQSTSTDEDDFLDYGLAFHIGGWRDVVPPEGEMQKLVNNIKTIRLELTDPVQIKGTLKPEIHIVVDVLKIIDGGAFDFSKVNQLHNPAMGTAMANALEKAFIVDHVHAN